MHKRKGRVAYYTMHNNLCTMIPLHVLLPRAFFYPAYTFPKEEFVQLIKAYNEQYQIRVYTYWTCGIVMYVPFHYTVYHPRKYNSEKPTYIDHVRYTRYNAVLRT